VPLAPIAALWAAAEAYDRRLLCPSYGLCPTYSTRVADPTLGSAARTYLQATRFVKVMFLGRVARGYSVTFPRNHPHAGLRYNGAVKINANVMI